MSLITKMFFLWQISIGINFLKKNEVAHLDLKPANIVVRHLFSLAFFLNKSVLY